MRVRTIRGVPLPKVPRTGLVGVDDWALRKGRTYGTIVVNLERHRPLVLLPDRLAAAGYDATCSDVVLDVSFQEVVRPE